MKRIPKFFVHHFAPHAASGERSLALRHEALLSYAVFLFLLQFALHLVSVKLPGVLGFASNIQVEEIVSLTNHEREVNGLPRLAVDERLSAAARQKGEYMFAKNYWAHIAPDGTTPWFFIQQSHYNYLYAGENLAKDFQNSTDVIGAWMASKMGHRENILSPNYRQIGIGVVNGVLDGFETTLVVQMFGAETGGTGEAFAAIPGNPVPSLSPATSPAPANPTPIPQSGTSPAPERSPAPTVEGRRPTEKPEAIAKIEPTAGSDRRLPLSSSAASGRNGPLLPVVDVVSFGKSVSYTFGFFLLGLFFLDALVAARRKLVRISGHPLAHLMIVILLIATTWMMSPGTIR